VREHGGARLQRRGLDREVGADGGLAGGELARGDRARGLVRGRQRLRQCGARLGGLVQRIRP
jgi:hypothetical protein